MINNTAPLLWWIGALWIQIANNGKYFERCIKETEIIQFGLYCSLLTLLIYTHIYICMCLFLLRIHFTFKCMWEERRVQLYISSYWWFLKVNRCMLWWFHLLHRKAELSVCFALGNLPCLYPLRAMSLFSEAQRVSSLFHSTLRINTQSVKRIVLPLLICHIKKKKRGKKKKASLAFTAFPYWWFF